ncbi:hypothetical protein LJR219_004024 [Phenylobacterium sp. LjRoot219]|uniref:hypothetical protein n=1 Tax=Phenylobacterium sp. LjRoot219 TaxID=3342283 RepID=UPI003ECCE4BA
MSDRALIFCMDTRGRVRASRELEFTTRADLMHQLQPELDRHPMVEAWAGSICLLRNGAPGLLEDDEL